MEKENKNNKDSQLDLLLSELNEKNNNGRDASIIPLIAMSSDSVEEQQPNNTYRFALNAIIEDRNEFGRIQNEESNEKCFRIKDVEQEGKVIANLCCSKTEFDYTASNIASQIYSLNVDCETEIHTGEWTIDGKEEKYSTVEVIEYLQTNIGNHRIYAICESTIIKITFEICCDNIIDICSDNNIVNIFEPSPFILTSEYVTELFNNHTTGMINEDEDGYMIEIDGTKYNEGDLPILIDNDTTVKLLCTAYNPCEIFANLEVDSGYSNDDVTTISVTKNLTTNYNIYDCSACFSSPNQYIAFYITDSCITEDMLSELYVEGELIPKSTEYNDNLDQYWYIDDNCHLIVKFHITHNGSYDFRFNNSECDKDQEIIVNIFKPVYVYDDNGDEIGYFEPTSMIILPEDQDIVIDGNTNTGLINRSISGLYTIINYEIMNIEGEIIKTETDKIYVDVRYNNTIKVHVE